ncbi:hypothetical protein ACN38_g6287, partial [Penicillium nordicum]
SGVASSLGRRLLFCRFDYLSFGDSRIDLRFDLYWNETGLITDRNLSVLNCMGTTADIENSNFLK